MQAFITINGHPYPYPKRGLDLQVETIVDSARNANGVVVGQKVGRDQQKINGLLWPYLDAETWSQILKEFDDSFYAVVSYPDMVNNRWTTRKMYPGPRSAKPFMLNETTGLPLDYTDCKVNIIDVGEPF